MTNDDIKFWLDIVKFLASIATPIIVAIIGISFLRLTESVKARVTKESDFHKKWAEQFFECCQEFMKIVERDLALLNAISQEPNNHAKQRPSASAITSSAGKDAASPASNAANRR